MQKMGAVLVGGGGGERHFHIGRTGWLRVGVAGKKDKSTISF